LFKIFWTGEAKQNYDRLRNDASLEKRFKAINKTIKLLAENPRHPGLQTHEFESLTKLYGKKVFEAYAEQNTPAAYRIFWCYGPSDRAITIIAITPHP
jgi:hypothetical protein